MSPRPSGEPRGASREKIFQFVRTRILEGFPPTIREVQEQMQFKSVQSAREHLDKLVDEGRLLKLPGRSRGYGLPEKLQEITGHVAESIATISNPASQTSKAFQTIQNKSTELLNAVLAESQKRWIPVLGRVQAGALTYASENVEGYIAASAPAGRGQDRQELFALRVQGDSMIGAGIYHGDVVVVRWQSTATIGDIVVAVVGDEATVKTFKIRDGRVVLQPENDDYEPICPDPDELIILGKVVELRRYFDGDMVSPDVPEVSLLHPV